MRLVDPVPLGSHVARNRLLFGPHVTNLGDGRAYSDRHVAYYERRAAGGCGTIVVEEASVHDSDWPYERSPLADEAATGWRRIAAAVHGHDSLVIAALGHGGGQGSSAYHQRPLWAPSRVPEVNTREVPKWMEPEDIAAVVDGFARAAALAAESGCDGVEINAGQHSLVRQFLSALTNQRDDAWGTDRLRFARDVLAAVRAAVGPSSIVGLRLCCDELAPWAGIKAEDAPPIARALSEHLDYLVVVRGSIYSLEQTRPDFHQPAGFNIDLTRSVREALPPQVAAVAQGSITDPAQATHIVDQGVADIVEMTRAQLADPDLGRKLTAGIAGRIRPCIRCNQTCQVRDARNPIVTCVGEPSAGHELADPDWYVTTSRPRNVLVVGGGPAGLETARVAATRGHHVRILERSDRLGGVAARRGPGADLVAWLTAECALLGVAIELGTEPTPADLHAADVVVVATGSRPGERTYDVDEGALVLDVMDPVLLDGALAERVAIWDPVGGPIAVALAEELGPRCTLVTPDAIAGNELSRTGDLAPANVRLQQASVRIERRSILRHARPGEIEIEHRYSGERTTLAVEALVDCGHRLPDDQPFDTGTTPHLRAGDCVAPRTLHEAILEGRRAALAIDAVR